MNKIVITIDGTEGVLVESKFSKAELEEAAAVIYNDAQSKDVYLDEEQIIVELEKKGYYKTLDEKVEIVEFYL